MQENRVVISGQLAKLYEVRLTPAGIPITRFVLEHQSQQTEAELKRNIHCQVFIIASGQKLTRQMKKLEIGQTLTVEGYLTQISFKGSNRQLCVNAEIIR